MIVDTRQIVAALLALTIALMALSFSGALKEDLWNAEDAILKTTGIVNRHIDEVAGTLPRQVGAHYPRLRRGTRG